MIIRDVDAVQVKPDVEDKVNKICQSLLGALPLNEDGNVDYEAAGRRVVEKFGEYGEKIGVLTSDDECKRDEVFGGFLVDALKFASTSGFEKKLNLKGPLPSFLKGMILKTDIPEFFMNYILKAKE